MNLQQIKDERKWNECLLDVQSVGELYLVATRSPKQDPCLAQKVEVLDKAGQRGTIVVYSKDETFAVSNDELGLHKYKVRYRGGYEGYPTESKQLNIGENLMKAPPSNKPQKEIPPAGTHLAICFCVCDLGTHEKVYPGKPPQNTRLIRLGWELPTCRAKFEVEGEMIDKPLVVGNEYTFSTYEKANLSMLVTPWMGGCPDDFDFETLIGAGCYLSIVHNTSKSNGNIYPKIAGTMQLPPGTPLPEIFNPPIFYDLTTMGKNIPESLLGDNYKWLKDKILACQEFRQMDQAEGQLDPANDPPYQAPEDDIPF